MQNMELMQIRHNKQKVQNLQKKILFSLPHEIFPSFSFSILHLLNQNAVKSKVQCPYSISRTCLAQEFGLFLIMSLEKGSTIYTP